MGPSLSLSKEALHVAGEVFVLLFSVEVVTSLGKTVFSSSYSQELLANIIDNSVLIFNMDVLVGRGTLQLELVQITAGFTQ